MKKEMTLATMALGLALALPISADQQLPHQANTETQPSVSLPLEQIAAPSDFSDDICWVAPEWREF